MTTFHEDTKNITTAGRNRSQLVSDIRRIETQHKMDMKMHNKEVQQFKAKYSKLSSNPVLHAGSEGLDVRMYETHNPGFCYRRDGECRIPVTHVTYTNFNFKEIQASMFTDGVIDLDKVLFVHLLSAHSAESLILSATALQKDLYGRGPSLYERLVDRTKKSTTKTPILAKLPLYVLDVKLIMPILKPSRVPKKMLSKVRFKDNLKFKALDRIGAGSSLNVTQSSTTTLPTSHELLKKEEFDDTISVFSEVSSRSAHSSTMDFFLKRDDSKTNSTERSKELEKKMENKMVVNEKLQKLIAIVLEALERSNAKKYEEFFSLAENVNYLKSIAKSPKITSYLKQIAKFDIIYNPDAFHLTIKNKPKIVLEVEIEKPPLYYIIKDIRRGVLTRNPGPTIPSNGSREELITESASDSSIGSAETESSSQSLERKQRKGQDLNLKQLATDLYKKAQEARQRDMEELKRPRSVTSISEITCTHAQAAGKNSGNSHYPGSGNLGGGATHKHPGNIKRTICDACLKKWTIPLPKPTVPSVVKVAKPDLTEDNLNRVVSSSSHRLSLIVDREAERVADDTRRVMLPKQKRENMYSRKLSQESKEVSVSHLVKDKRHSVVEVEPLPSTQQGKVPVPVEDEAVQLARMRQEIVDKEMNARVAKFLTPSQKRLRTVRIST